MNKVWRFSNKYGVRTIYGVVADSPEEVFNSGLFKSYKSYFIIPKNRLVDMNDKYATNNNVSILYFKSDPTSESVLEVPKERSSAKHVLGPTQEEFSKMIFILPYQLPYQQFNLDNHRDAETEGYTTPEDLYDLKTKRLLTISWASNGNVTATILSDWMSVIESCPVVLEGVFHGVFCGACKNIFSKLSGNCSVNFLTSITCIMGLNTSREVKRSESHGDYSVSADLSETSNK